MNKTIIQRITDDNAKALTSPVFFCEIFFSAGTKPNLKACLI